MDIHYRALASFWPDDDDHRPAAERTLSGGETSWVVRDVQVLLGPDDVLIAASGTNDYSRWVQNGRKAFDPTMTFVEIDLRMADGPLHRSAWETFLRTVGDLEQLGLSPLEPVGQALDPVGPQIHRPLSQQDDERVSRVGHLP